MAADLDRLIQHSQFLISNLQYPIFNFPFSFSHSSFPIIPRFSNIPHLTLQLKLFAFILDLINNSFKIGFFFSKPGPNLYDFWNFLVKNAYSQLSLRRTPSGLAPTAHLREVSV